MEADIIDLQGPLILTGRRKNEEEDADIILPSQIHEDYSSQKFKK